MFNRRLWMKAIAIILVVALNLGVMEGLIGSLSKAFADPGKVRPGDPSPFDPSQGETTTFVWDYNSIGGHPTRLEIRRDGEVVKVLADGEHYGYGTHETVWDGSTDYGIAEDGIYEFWVIPTDWASIYPEYNTVEVRNTPKIIPPDNTVWPGNPSPFDPSVGETTSFVWYNDDPMEGSGHPMRLEIRRNGQVVRVLADGEFYGTGTHETIWDGWTNSGPAEDGIYEFWAIPLDWAGEWPVYNTVEVYNRPRVNIIQPEDLTPVSGQVPIGVQGENINSITLSITDQITGEVILRETAQTAEKTWLWDSTDVLDGSYLIKVLGRNGRGDTAEDQVTIEVQNFIPGMGVSARQAVNNFILNSQQLGTVNHNGNLVLQSSDLVWPGKGIPLSVSRYYNSQQGGKSELGPGWHLAIPYLTPKLDGSVAYTNETGKQFRFIPGSGGSYQTPPGTRLKLSKQPGGTYKMEHPALHLTWDFSAKGLLLSVTDRNGNKV